MFSFLRIRIIALSLSFLAAGSGNVLSADHPREELLIYCGITMIQPMEEIAEVIEKERGCTIKITKGGSGNLLDAIRFNQVGDLFIPGSESYMTTCLADGLVEDAVWVGFNVAAMVVQKGNPKGILPDPACLTNRAYSVVIGDPGSGSVGREAKAVLERRGVLDEVMERGPLFTTDSKDVSGAIGSGEADLGINWYATTLWAGNRDRLDALMMDEKYAPHERLMLGILRFSRFPDTARRFMEYATSAEGRMIFRKYGFFPPKSASSPDSR